RGRSCSSCADRGRNYLGRAPMSGWLFANEHPIESYVPDARVRGKAIVVRGTSISSRDSTLVREILSNLETLTVAGQRHTMGKVSGFISEMMERLGPAVSLRARSASTELLSRMAYESERLSPDVGSFCRSAEGLLELLSASTRFGPNP